MSSEPTPRNFLWIAGPCAVESQAQLFECATFLKDFFARSLENNFTQKSSFLFRAGAWKPRTRPGGFEGLGEEAVKLLIEVKKQFGIKVCTEVATAEHARICLKYGIDTLWIGARTTGNPFAVQEIADVLKSCDTPVFIKNPISPDLNLWLGAVERIEKNLNATVGVIHRGFSQYPSGPYRNHPLWEVPIEFKRIRPDIPIICDPSHIAGKRALVPGLAQKALNLEMDGLMTEVHPFPEEAQSDKDQQLSFEEFSRMCQALIFRCQEGGAEPLAQLRTLLDELDEELLHILHKRCETVKKMGQLKRDHNLSVLQINRWTEVYESRLDMAERLGMQTDFIRDILKCLHQESLRIQNDILDSTNQMECT